MITQMKTKFRKWLRVPGVGRIGAMALSALALVIGAQTVSAAAPSWTPASGVAYSMTVHGSVLLPDGATWVSHENSLLAAFYDGECRGVTNIFDGSGPEMQFQLAIGSNSAVPPPYPGSETMTLKVYDGVADEVMDITETVPFVLNTTVGALASPATYNAVANPMTVTAATPGTPADLDTDTVTVAGQVTVQENGSQAFTVTPSGGLRPYSYAWTRGGVSVGGDSDTYTFSPDYDAVAHPATANPSEAVVCTIMDSAGTPATATVTWDSLVTEDVDRAQSDPVVEIVETAPTTTDDLTLNYTSTSTDPDGDTVTVTVTWTLQGVGTTLTGATLTSDNTAKGQTWDVSVTASTNPYELGAVNATPSTDSVTILDTNPVADGQSADVIINTVLSIQLTGTDPDVDDGEDTLIFDIPGGMTLGNGILSDFDANAGTVSYTPDTDFLGSDSFDFVVSDDGGSTWSAAATVTIDVFLEELDMPITVTGAVVEQIEIGAQNGATDNVDTSDPLYDHPSPPAMPDQGNVRLISPLPETPVKFLRRDMRGRLLGASYQIQVKSDQNSDVVLSWDPMDLPDVAYPSANYNWHIVQLTDKDGDIVDGTAVDMAAVTQITAAVAHNTPGAVTTTYYRISSPAEVTIDTVSPSTADVAGGETVTVTGTGFVDGLTLTFGGEELDVTFVDSTELTFVTPAYTLWSADVKVTNPDGGSATETDAVLFNSDPTADAGVEYAIAADSDLVLDGSGSSDPDTANGDALTYEWDLDNDGNYDDATGVNPTVSAAELDTLGIGDSTGSPYTIGLRVKDMAGATSTDTSTVAVVDAAPDASFVMAPVSSTIDRNQSVSFTSTSGHFGIGTNVAWEWDFDYSGTPAEFVVRRSGQTVTTFFPWMRSYTIALRVTDDQGATDIAVKTITVSGNNTAPVANAGGPYTASKTAGITLDGSDSSDADEPYGDSIVSFAWDLDGDGQYDDASGETVSLSWLQLMGIAGPGSSAIALLVTDSFGETSTDTTTLDVPDNSAPVVDAGSDKSCFPGDSITLDGSASDVDTPFGDSLTYAWDLNANGIFGALDGEPTVAAPSMTWAELGTYGVSGTVTAVLKVTDSFGAVSTDSIQLTAEPDRAPTADAGGPYGPVAVLGDVTFDGSGSSDPDTGDSLTYAWDLDGEPVDALDFDDGADAVVGPTVTWQTLADLGLADGAAHAITLRVTDSYGETHTDTTTVVVSASTAPTADAGGPYTTVVVLGSVTLNATGSSDADTNDSIASYEWDLDGDLDYADGADAVAEPTITWQALADLGLADDASHTITLRVTDQTGATGTATVGLTVSANSNPMAQFDTAPATCTVNADVTFEVSATDADTAAGDAPLTYGWDLTSGEGTGDFADASGTTLTVGWQALQDTYGFVQGVAKDVYVKVSDTLGGEHVISTSLTVLANQVPVVDAGGVYTLLAGKDLALAGSATDADDTVASYGWELDGADDDYDEATGATPTVTWADLVTFGISGEGDHTITLKATDTLSGEGTDTATLTIVGNDAPVANAGGPYNSAVTCELLLDGSASSDPNVALGDSIVSYEWDLDDNGTYNETDEPTGETPAVPWSVVQAYGLDDEAAHTIRLRVTDSLGLTHEATTTVTIVNDADLDPRAWTFTFDVAFGSESQLVIGVGPTATDGLDTGVDVEAGSALMDETLTVVGLSDGTDLQTSIINNDNDSVAGPDGYQAWVLKLTAGNSDVFLLWDSDEVPSAGMWLMEMEEGPFSTTPEADGRFMEDAEAIDMSAAVEGLTVDAGETKYYRVIYGSVQFTLNVKAGWNMMSLPIEPFDPTAAAADLKQIPPYVAGTLNGWNVDLQEYTIEPMKLHALEGYWGFFDGSTDIVVTGLPVSDVDVVFPYGDAWYFRGVAATENLAGNADLFLPAYSWDPDRQVYDVIEVGDQLIPGRAYWINAINQTLFSNPVAP